MIGNTLYSVKHGNSRNSVLYIEVDFVSLDTVDSQETHTSVKYKHNQEKAKTNNQSNLIQYYICPLNNHFLDYMS